MAKADWLPDWKPATKPPPDGRVVLIWWTRAFTSDDYRPVPGPAFGRYVHGLKEWRPSGCNGNFNDEVTHWDYLPKGPSATES